MHIFPVLLQGIGIGHEIVQRKVFHKVNTMARLLELRAYHPPRIDRRDAERNERRRYVDILERPAHGILAADGRESESLLHLQRTEQSRQRLTPRMGVVGHAFEILLIRETHPLETGARRNRFRHRLHDRIGRTVIRAPFGDERIETESHDARRIGVPLPYGNLLHRHLRLGLLRPAAVGHQYRRSAYRGVEHLHHALLRHDIVVRQKRPHLLRDARPRHFAQERIATFDTGHGCLRAVLGSGTVYEFAGEVHDELSLMIHSHPAGIGHIRHMRHLYILLGTVTLELLPGRLLYHDGHTLLRLADGEFRGVQAAVFGRHTVEIDVQPVGQLADGHADAPRTEVI